MARTRILWPFVVASSLAAGCGTPTARPAAPPVAQRRVAAVGMELGGKRLKPHVRGTLAGQPVIFFLDTGASSHVLTLSAVKKAGLTAAETSISGSDHAGAPVVIRRVEKPDVAIAGLGKVDVGNTLVADVPAFFDDLGIAGFLNPQLLGRDDEETVLILSASTLSIGAPGSMPGPVAGKSFGGPLSACEQPDEHGIRSRVFILSSDVDGHAVRLELDTGAVATDLFASSQAGAALSGKSTTTTEAHGALEAHSRSRASRLRGFESGRSNGPCSSSSCPAPHARQRARSMASSGWT